MPDFSCAVADVATDATCSDRGGLLTVFAIDDSSVDWDAMTGVLYYDDATHTILDWATVGGASFAEFTFERKSGRLDSTYTADNGFYEVALLNLLFSGKSASRSITLGQLIGCCGLILQIHDNNSLARVIGKEYISGGWVNALERGRVIRHLDTTGAFGSADDKNRDEMDFGAQHLNPLPYASLTVAEMRAIGGS